jgi:hypothetical protein
VTLCSGEVASPFGADSGNLRGREVGANRATKGELPRRSRPVAKSAATRRVTASAAALVVVTAVLCVMGAVLAQKNLDLRDATHALDRRNFNLECDCTEAFQWG